MKIAAHLEFDTFAEAERVFRHLELLDAAAVASPPLAKEPERSLQETVRDANAALVTNGTGATHQSTTQSAANGTGAHAAPTVDDLVRSFQAYVGRGGGCKAANAMVILQKFGLKNVKAASPDQVPRMIAVFDAATPDKPVPESV